MITTQSPREGSLPLLGGAASNHFTHEAAGSKNFVLDGAYAQPGTNLTMFVPDDIWVWANFKETQLDAMRPVFDVSRFSAG